MNSFRARTPVQLAVALAVTTASVGAAQQAQPAVPTAPDVGQMAPDFTLPGATRYGLLKEPVRLAEFRGNTVVVAFFPKARTKG